MIHPPFRIVHRDVGLVSESIQNLDRARFELLVVEVLEGIGARIIDSEGNDVTHTGNWSKGSA